MDPAILTRWQQHPDEELLWDDAEPGGETEPVAVGPWQLRGMLARAGLHWSDRVDNDETGLQPPPP